MIANVMSGFRDLLLALQSVRTWYYLGLWEVRLRYRRSILGPWWISITMLIFVSAMGTVYSRLFAQDMAQYLPFFTAGLLFWILISSTINDSTELFNANGGLLKQDTLPYHLYVFKLLTKNVLIMMHNLVIYFLVVCFFFCNPGWNIVLVLPGFLILLMNLYWVSLVVALVSVRFRDMVPIINSCMQIAFLVTPISWMPKLLAGSLIVKVNPLVYLLAIVRAPLLGKAPSGEEWVVAFALGVIGSLFALLLFGKVRNRIPFWVD